MFLQPIDGYQSCTNSFLCRNEFHIETQASPFLISQQALHMVHVENGMYGRCRCWHFNIKLSLACEIVQCRCDNPSNVVIIAMPR
jgi:hypothetical protein